MPIDKIISLALLATNAATAQILWKLRATSPAVTGMNGIDFYQVRGASAVAVSDSGASKAQMSYISTMEGAYEINFEQTDIVLPVTKPVATTTPMDIAFAGDHVTKDMLFLSQLETSDYNKGLVHFYRGEYSSWSLQQTLMPPAEFYEQNRFGNYIDLDRNHLRKLVVSCILCNVTHADSGAIFVYEPTSPTVKKWSQTAILSPTEDAFNIGVTFLVIDRGVIVTNAYDTNAYSGGGAAPLLNALVWKYDSREGWSQQQSLALSGQLIRGSFDDYVGFGDVYDETIVLTNSLRVVRGHHAGAGGYTYDQGVVEIFYPNTERYHPGPKWKPKLVQWSLQQILASPDAVKTDPLDPSTTGFGTTVSIDGNRMVVGDNSKAAFVYERRMLHGMWSLQQKVALAEASATGIVLSGNSFIASETTYYEFFDETEHWDCLLVSVEDHFGDGWDSAHLVVDVPVGGEKDEFAPMCETANPFQFRYCPSSCDDEGLYKFSIPKAKESMFHWEMLWRVYEESSGQWYTGNWDTQMDFEWDCERKQFNSKKIEKKLPNNITCKECKQEPTKKPYSRLRQLHSKSKDQTIAPTLSPAPTLETNPLTTLPWQFMTLISNNGDWFDSQHRGTSYYISTKDGKRLLSVGTQCPWQAGFEHTCWEDYPDGDYILRVGGALDRVTDHTFKFCGAINEISQETQIVFRIGNGECMILSNLKSSQYCEHTIGVIQQATVSITLAGIPSSSLGATEYQHLATALASVIKGAGSSDAKIVSSSSNGEGVSFTIQVSVHARELGLDLRNVDVLEAYETNTAAYLQSTDGAGALLGAIMSEETRSALHSVSSVHIYAFELSGSSDESVELQHMPGVLVQDFADELLGDLPEESVSDLGRIMDLAVKTSAIVGYLLMGAVVAFFAYRGYKSYFQSRGEVGGVPLKQLVGSQENSSSSSDDDDEEDDLKLRPYASTASGQKKKTNLRSSERSDKFIPSSLAGRSKSSSRSRKNAY